jgi:hypothetical protein
VPVQTVGEVIRRYRLRPEHKSLAANGEPAGRDTVGLLQRRPVESNPDLQDLTGKEGNKLLERSSGEVIGPAEYRADYGSRGDRWMLTVQAVRHLGAGPVAAQAGLNRRTLERVIRNDRPSVAHRANRARIAQAAAQLASATLREAGQPAPSSTFAILTAYLQFADAGGLTRVCRCDCGRRLPPGRRIWFEDACRARSRR